MAAANDLKKFIDAQETQYEKAFSEIKRGRKTGHWMWYIFPQIQGLGFSETSRYYAIKDLEEAKQYFEHPVLGNRLIRISEVLLHLESSNATQIFGSPDDVKLKSSMTLFGSLPHTSPVFQSVLDKFFRGAKDGKTVQILKAHQI